MHRMLSPIMINRFRVRVSVPICSIDIDQAPGYGNFTFFIGLLPAAYTFSAIGMIASMVCYSSPSLVDQC